MWESVLGVAAVILIVATYAAVRAVLRNRSAREEVSPWSEEESGWTLPDAAKASQAAASQSIGLEEVGLNRCQSWGARSVEGLRGVGTTLAPRKKSTTPVSAGPVQPRYQANLRASPDASRSETQQTAELFWLDTPWQGDSAPRQEYGTDGR